MSKPIQTSQQPLDHDDMFVIEEKMENSIPEKALATRPSASARRARKSRSKTAPPRLHGGSCTRADGGGEAQCCRLHPQELRQAEADEVAWLRLERHGEGGSPQCRRRVGTKAVRSVYESILDAKKLKPRRLRSSKRTDAVPAGDRPGGNQSSAGFQVIDHDTLEAVPHQEDAHATAINYFKRPDGEVR